MQQDWPTGKTCPGDGKNDKKKTLSAMILLVKLMTDPTYQRRRWEMRNFRYRFFLRTLFVYPVATFRYLRALCELEDLEQLLEAIPVLPAKLHRPYLYRSNAARQRAQAVLEHYQFVRTQPEQVRRYLQGYRETPLVSAEGRGGELISVTCTPSGFDREGELMLVLYCGGTPVIRISFSFIRWQGKFTLFIGGLQGPREDGAATIRHTTRACHGLFPRRVLCEAVAALAEVCRLNTITAVSEERHVLRHDRYAARKEGRFVARYSECWIAAGGVYDSNGFYRLPVPLPRKGAEDIPARKRAEYRRRNALLDSIRSGILDICRDGIHSVNGRQAG
ncbi:regulator of virG protein [Escherichia coli]|nr:regulator of virG protein [Escherichia coli]